MRKGDLYRVQYPGEDPMWCLVLEVESTMSFWGDESTRALCATWRNGERLGGQTWLSTDAPAEVVGRNGRLISCK